MKKEEGKKRKKTVTLKILYYNYVDTKSVERMKCKEKANSTFDLASWTLVTTKVPTLPDRLHVANVLKEF